MEDSLVSTVGLLSGVAIAGLSGRAIFLTGIVLVFVEAFSMGAGSFLADSSAEEYTNIDDPSYFKVFFESLIMFFSYLIAGIIPLFPYMFFAVTSAFIVSVSFTLFALFVLGVISGKIVKRNLFVHGFKMLIIGGIAILVGIMAGKISDIYIG